MILAVQFRQSAGFRSAGLLTTLGLRVGSQRLRLRKIHVLAYTASKGGWTFLPRTGQWTVAWGTAKRGPRDQGHREPLLPRQGRGISVQPAFRRPCRGATELDGHQPGASLTLCPRLLSRAPPGRLEQPPASLQARNIDLLSWWPATRILQASNTTGTSNLQVLAYTASKGGVAQLTKALSTELAPRNINVNGIAPGYFATELNQGLLNDTVRLPQINARISAVVSNLNFCDGKIIERR